VEAALHGLPVKMPDYREHRSLIEGLPANPEFSAILRQPLRFYEINPE
jgi:hypothetical protein